ncbi:MULTISPECIES: hormogonium polysaccharide secretion pseudopilin HpsC [unclassified Microcoleus]|uniref:hormogonium polysaccharide secretion pseudopilin HpsC n=1 Tax=unclassified Microcoleus TaxID=2642155 RepID=UPI002FCF5B2A
MKSLLRLLLKTQYQRNRSGPAQTEKGMTLVELLVGAIMAFLIITPMLGFVVDMLNTDRREQVKSNTEQDLQAAVDFIAQDLSQAIYIYDNKDINVGTAANPAIRNQLPENGNPNRIPILVFWKRQQIPKSVPINPNVAARPNTCTAADCNDAYVLSLVAYYQFKDNDVTWCQPLGVTCPTRIARYEIRDGVKNPSTLAYYTAAETTTGQTKDPAFNANFDPSKPTQNVTEVGQLRNPLSTATKPEILVNYIDNSTVNVPPPPNCKTTLGVTDPPAPAPALTPTDLLTADGSTNSFYACVDKSNNIARVTIRGNSLRRLQANDAEFKTTSSAYFPTATVQVQGFGAVGK